MVSFCGNWGYAKRRELETSDYFVEEEIKSRLVFISVLPVMCLTSRGYGWLTLFRRLLALGNGGFM